MNKNDQLEILDDDITDEEEIEISPTAIAYGLMAMMACFIMRMSVHGVRGEASGSGSAGHDEPEAETKLISNNAGKRDLAISRSHQLTAEPNKSHFVLADSSPFSGSKMVH